MALKRIKCEVCGQPAMVDSRRRGSYCDNPECIKEYTKRKNSEYQKRYLERLKIAPSVNADSERVVRPIFREAVYGINTVPKVNQEPFDKLELGDIREIARELGTIRFKLIEMYQKESEQVKDLDKDDITLLHSFELEDLTKEEVWEMYKKTKERRVSRRSEKNRRALIGELLNSILIKNPDKFIVKAVNDGRKNKDFLGVIEELKKDESIFVQPQK